MAHYFIPNQDQSTDESPRVPRSNQTRSDTKSLESTLGGLCFAPTPEAPTYELLASQTNMLGTHKSAIVLLNQAQALLNESERDARVYQSESPIEFYSSHYSRALALVLDTILPSIKIATLEDIGEYARTLTPKEQNLLLPCRIYATSNHIDTEQATFDVVEVFDSKRINVRTTTPDNKESFYILLKRTN